jgi:hypothetical protein
MGCKQDTFPQVYLGLPLSNMKVRLATLALLIAKVDRYLARWRAIITTEMICINASFFRGGK